MPIDDNRKLVPELKELCKERGLRGYSRMRKNQLIAHLKQSDVMNHGPIIQPVPEVSKRTIGVQTERRRTDDYVRRQRERKIEKHERERLREARRKKVEGKRKGKEKKEEEKEKKEEKAKAKKKKKRKKKKKGIKEEETYELQETAWALDGTAKQYTIGGWGCGDANIFFARVKPKVIDLLKKNRQKKVGLTLTCIMERVNIKTGKVETAVPYFHSEAAKMLEATDVNEFYENAVNKIKESIDKYQRKGSNWRLRSVVKLDIKTIAYKPLRGKSYFDLPQELKAKKAIVNMKNDDNQCFKWCVTRALNPVDDNPQRITQDLRTQAEKLNWQNINFPVCLDGINIFEKDNPGIKKINVFGYK